MNPDTSPAPINDLTPSPVQTQNHALLTKEVPATGHKGRPVLVQSPAEVQANSDMNLVNGSVPSSDSEVPNPPKDQDPDLNQNGTEDRRLNLVRDSTQSPGSDPTNVTYPVQIKNLDQNQTIVLTKPLGPDQGSAQSIVVRVPAMALLKALVQNSGQSHVRIPLQTQGPGSVLVPSTAPSNIHLTASVQSLIQHPGVVQNKVQSPGIVLSPVRNPGPVRSTGLVQNRFQSPGKLRSPVTKPLRSLGLAQKPIKIKRPLPTTASVQIPATNPVQTKSFVTTQAQAQKKDNPAESSSDPEPGLDPDLVQVSLPRVAVRALSPPLKTTPLKPSVPPLGFRLNGKLIPLLPGAEEGVKLSLLAHPPGSKSRLTSLHLTKPPAPTVFPEVPRPSVRLPRPFCTVPREPPPKKSPPPPKMKMPKIGPPPKPKPRVYVTLPKPHTEKSKVDVFATILRKSEVIRKRPADCTVCMSQFKPVPELRGFACMCSSDVTSALQILKLRRKDERVKSRLKKKLKLLNQQQRVAKPQPYHSYAASKSLSSLQKPLRASEHFLPEPHPSPSPGVLRPHPSPSPGALVRSEVSSPGSGAEVTVGGAVGRLVIHLEDFYYGSAEGVGAVEQVRIVSLYRCMHCAQVLANNISLMHHTWEHMKEYFRGYCSYCFRQFFSSVKLQRHLETVHGLDSGSSRVVCRICEFEFENEVTLLLHMKEIHKPGEMPYACELCGFRSSFFAQTWRHFEKAHSDTRHLLCQFCLRVFKMDYNYQQHVARHLKKNVYSCSQCRLHFHLAKDRQDHQEQHHDTHLRPAQLSGLRPGTTVSVRTFQVAPPESPVQTKPSAALSKVVPKMQPKQQKVSVRTFQVAPPESPVQTKPSAALSKVVPKVQPKQQKVCKRKAVESLGQLLAQLHSSERGRCVECLSLFQDFPSHFPARVTCSCCHFQTCCSRAYANHMIDNHSLNRSCPLYPQVFASSPRSHRSLECLTCGFSCQTGDAMALHLVKNIKHTCLLVEGAAEELSDCADEQSSVVEGGFVSIERLSSSHLSITTLQRPARLSSPAAMTITVGGPAHPLPKPAPPLAVSRLSALLHSLLHGIVAASRLFGVSQYMLLGWARGQRKSLSSRRWRWDARTAARWVLTEREKNHAVTQEDILDLCRRTLGPKTQLHARLNWAVDFLLRHDLGVETRSKELRDTGFSVVGRTWNKMSSLAIPPSRFCCLDEFPVFMDPGVDSSLASDALRVLGRREERPLVEVLLCGTSDGSLLVPMMFYNKDLPPLPLGFPTNIILQAREGGYSLKERAQLWTNKVWLPHLVDSAPSLLLLDEHCGHMTPDFLEPLRRANSELVHIPQGCSFLVQPLDQCVAPVVREFLKVRWSQLVSQGPDFSESDLVLTLACWFSEVCHTLNTNKEYIHRSFLSVGARYKTAEVTHNTLKQSLHRALIQTAPLVSAVSQSEEAEERKEEVGLRTDEQSSLQELEQQTEVMEVDQSQSLEAFQGESDKSFAGFE